MSGSLYGAVLETQEWFIRNENVLSKAEYRQWIEINNRANYSDDERQFLNSIRKKYDPAYELLTRIKKTSSELEVLTKNKARALPEASCEILIDDKKLMENMTALKDKVQYWKARCQRAEDKSYWLETELAGLKQTASINAKARVMK